MLRFLSDLGRPVAALALALSLGGPAIAGEIEQCLAARDRACLVELAATAATEEFDAEARMGRFGRLARLLFSVGAGDAALPMLARAEAVAAAMPDAREQDNAYAYLAETRAAVGDLAGGLHWAERVRDPVTQSIAYELVAGDALDAGDLAIVEELLAYVTDEGVRQLFLEALCRAYASAGDWPRALAIARTLDLSVVPELVQRLARELVLAGREADVQSLRGQMPTPHLEAQAQRGVVEAWVGRGEFDAAQAAADAIGDSYWREVALASIAKGLLRGGAVARGEAVLAQLSEGVLIDEGVVELAAARTQQGNVAAALTLASRQSVEATRLRNPYYTKRLQARVYDTVAMTQAGTGDLTGALETARRIPDRGDRSITLGKLATASIDAGDRNGGLRVLDELLGGEAFAQSLYYTVLRTAVVDLSRAGEVARALGLAYGLANASDRAFTLLTAAEAVATDAAAFGALMNASGWAAHAIEEEGTRERALARMATVYARNGDVALAATLLDGLGAEQRYDALMAIAFPGVYRPQW